MAGLSRIFNPKEATMLINGNLFSDFAAGENISITYPNDLHTITRGMDGSAIFKKRSDGTQGSVKFSLLTASKDDRFLNNCARNSEMLSGSYRCPYKDSDGNVIIENLSMEGGIVRKIPDIERNDSDGKEMLQYEMIFSIMDRLV